MPAAPARRWSKRALVISVLGLVLATAVLAVGMVGFARSIGFVTGIGAASEVLTDVGQIAAEVTSAGRASASPGVNASGGADVAPAELPSGLVGSPAPTVAGGAASGGAFGTSSLNQATAGGTGGGAGGGGAAGSGGTAGFGGASGGGGSGGALNSWESFVQNTLTQLRLTTTNMCGPNTCNLGQVCCNPSCGICVAPGATCDQTVCAGAARTPTAAPCGSTQCNDGLVCCNPTCGICVAPGETCDTQSCP